MTFSSGKGQESCLWAEITAITFDVLDGCMFRVGNTTKQQLHLRYGTKNPVSSIANYSSHHKTAIYLASILTLDTTREQSYGFIGSSCSMYSRLRREHLNLKHTQRQEKRTNHTTRNFMTYFQRRRIQGQ
jgi:hypothetical protein